MEAVEAFNAMLQMLRQSPHERVRGESFHQYYVAPSLMASATELRPWHFNSRPMIRRLVAAAVSYVRRVLIDTTTGRLFDRTQQAEAFKALPIFNELILLMIDEAHIWKEVTQFYRYMMLSHN